MSHKMDDEILLPGTERFYEISNWNRWVEPDGVVIICAGTTEGSDIWLGYSPSQGYEVLVGAEGRRYRGGPGSPAHERFEKFQAVYEALCGLDDPPEPEDTEPTR